MRTQNSLEREKLVNFPLTTGSALMAFSHGSRRRPFARVAFAFPCVFVDGSDAGVLRPLQQALDQSESGFCR